jgi:hypothetical protein
MLVHADHCLYHHTTNSSRGVCCSGSIEERARDWQPFVTSRFGFFHVGIDTFKFLYFKYFPPGTVSKILSAPTHNQHLGH